MIKDEASIRWWGLSLSVIIHEMLLNYSIVRFCVAICVVFYEEDRNCIKLIAPYYKRFSLFVLCL